MNRVDIIQRLLGPHALAYLEIGVERGNSFFPIRAREKYAVDPAFMICPQVRLQRSVCKEQYFEMTSDEFFRNASKLPIPLFDLVFIDGNHTYEQSRRDVQNSLRVLKPNGYIVLHDCNPTSYSMAYPAKNYAEAEGASLPGWTGEWCGDVWKTVVHLRTTRPDLEVTVVDTDYGVGIIRRRPSWSCTPGLPSFATMFSHLEYSCLAEDRVGLLNLKPVSYLAHLNE